MSNLLRSALVVCSFSLLAAAGAVVVSSGCDDTCDPDIDPNCTRFLFEPSDAAPPSCVPSENAGSIPASCGIFVSIAKPIDPELGTLEGEGTKDAPFRKLSDAITLARKTKQPIYVCAEVFKEAIRVPEGVTIYGGMSCFVANWVYPLIGGDGKAKKTTVAPDAGKVPLKVIENTSEGGSSEDAGVRAARLFDFAFLAADAKTAGGSSIAAIFDAVNVELTRCDLRAGSGASGAAGEKPPSDSSSPSDPDDPAIAGNAGSPSCMGGGTGNPGAEAKANMLCAASIGGAGGVGLEDMGVAGLPGQPAVEGFGVGGIGAVEPDTCLAGTNGRVGQSGAAGFGALKDDVGKITIAGYTGPSGQFGAPGEPGQGGGGGGGAKGAPNCYGASGGSGGAGGCGGKGGGGGQGGGSSIALVSLGANLVMTDVLLMAADGGKGGDGAEGQSGGVGGRGGKSGAGVPEMGLLPSCSGGDGGQGGFGGRGGGGRGGHSLGLAYAGAAPSLTGITFQVGAPGLGGAGEGASGKGATGVVAETRFFP